MFYYGNTSSNDDHYDNNNNKTMQSHHHNQNSSNNNNNNHIEASSFLAGDSFPVYLQQQQQQQQQSNPSSATAQNIPMQQQHHPSATNDSSLFFGYNDSTNSQTFDSSFLNDPLLTLAGQEYEVSRELDEQHHLQKNEGFDTHKDLSAYFGTSWNQLNNNNISLNNNNHGGSGVDDMMFLSQQQIQQLQQQHIQNEQHQHHNLTVTPDNKYQQQQHHKEAENAILNAFTGLGQQDEQAILLSDPNFVRQQHLLQEQQRMMHMRQEEEDTATIGGGMMESDTTETMMRSNLSAMFSSDDKADPNVTSLQPSLDNSSFTVTSRLPYSPGTPAPEIKQEQNYQQQQEQQQLQQEQQLLQQQQSWEEAMFIEKQLLQHQQQQQKHINNNARVSKRISSPIPIKGMDTSCSDSPVSSSVPSEVDHQRRQNELQARFRITYARKPQQQQQQMQKSGRSSAAIATPSSFSGSSAAHVQPSSILGASVPNMPSSNMEGFDTDLVMSSPQISLTPDPSLQNSSPLGKNQDAKAGAAAAAGAAASSSSSLPTSSPGTGSGNNNVRATSKSPSAQHQQPINFPSRTMPIQIQRVQRASVPQPVDVEQHQRKLDDQLEKVDFDDITVSELKDMLRQRGKPATGKKAILVQRLQDERDFIRAVKSGTAQRHSQPPLSASYTSKLNEGNRPRSYQGSSPLTPHANIASFQPQSPLLAGSSPSSMPNTFVPPGSPGSVTLSLNRSIANMHIGSPPQHPRRYSPYATPGSPRMNSASPKLQPQRQANYSSSVPTNALSSSPNSLTYGSPLSSSFTGRSRPINAYVPTTNGRPKSYAPFTSSALATPDRDDDRDPFDDLTMEDQEYIKSEQDERYIKQENMTDYPTASSLPASEPIKMEGIDTSNSGSTSILKNANIPENAYDYLSEGFTREDLLAVLAGQGLRDPTMGLQTTATEGYISNDNGSSSANMMLFDHLDNLNRYQ
ncbi:hypothetical protein BDC45DRAFT_607325 [Circinella umbellata]|nr:hypothetical protein BDC45DRAFT_607325 [Circinella umbellata]